MTGEGTKENGSLNRETNLNFHYGYIELNNEPRLLQNESRSIKIKKMKTYVPVECWFHSVYGDAPLLHLQPQSISKGDSGVFAHAVSREPREGVPP